MFLFCVGIAPILSLRLLIRTTLGFQAAAGQKRIVSHRARRGHREKALLATDQLGAGFLELGSGFCPGGIENPTAPVEWKDKTHSTG